MGEIKSAWEIAQEKVEKLGELSAEELRMQKEERSNSIGRFLVEKYLVNPEPKELLEALNKHKGEERELIKRAIITRLVEAIELGKTARLQDLNKGLSAILGEGQVTRNLGEIGGLFQEYNQLEQTVKQQIDQAGKEMLHQFRISGTAIGEINPQAKEEWQKTLSSFAQPFEERLKRLKQELLTLLNPTVP